MNPLSVLQSILLLSYYFKGRNVCNFEKIIRVFQKLIWLFRCRQKYRQSDFSLTTNRIPYKRFAFERPDEFLEYPKYFLKVTYRTTLKTYPIFTQGTDFHFRSNADTR